MLVFIGGDKLTKAAKFGLINPSEFSTIPLEVKKQGAIVIRLKVELTFLQNFFRWGSDYIARFYAYAGGVALSDI